MILFQGDQATAVENSAFDLVFEAGDIISVHISCPDPKACESFNQQVSLTAASVPSYNNGVAATTGYLINPDSTIALPIVGDFIAAGKSRLEFISSLEEALKEYMDEPQVTVRLMNFKVTVLGEVEHPGTFNIPNDRITIPEAIGLANDLKLTAKRNNILIVRTENDSIKEYRVDLTSNQVFTSPVYFLKQNDVVYVEPNKKSRYDGSLLHSAGGLIISATSLIISTFILIQK